MRDIRCGMAVLTALLLSLTLEVGAATSADVQSTQQSYEIPAGDLGAALKAFAGQSGLQIIFSPDLVRGKTSHAVAGNYSPSEALKEMLAGSGLTVEAVNASTFVVKRIVPASHMSRENITIAEVPQAIALEEIIVTAQKRAEDVQEVPTSVQVIAGQALAEQNHNSLEALTETVPAVHVERGNQSTSDMYIRGIGSGGNVNFDESVATFIDDIYHGRSPASNATFVDVDRVEILKGPQSTYFGNNAIAGALNIVSKKPGDKLDAAARLLYGQFGTYAAEGAIGGPIADMFGARLAVTRNGIDKGWIDNVSVGEMTPRVNNEAGRLTLAFKPNQDLEATLKIEGSKHRLSGSAEDFPSQWNNCPPPLAFTLNVSACAGALSAGVPIGLSQNSTSTLAGQFNSLSTIEDVLTVNYLKWGQTFTSVSGYFNYNFKAAYDLANLPTYSITAQTNPEQYHQFSQEFRVASPLGGAIEYLAGGYFQTDHFATTTELNVPAFNFFYVGSAIAPYLPLATLGTERQREHVYSGFGSLSWNATDRLKVTAGLRDSRVTKNSYVDTPGPGTGTQIYGGFVPLPQSIQALVGASPLGFFFGGSPGTGVRLSRTDRALMPSADIKYQPRPQMMAYFRFDQGFKAGGMNPPNPGGSAKSAQFGPEHVNAYELGLKSTWFDGRLLLNLDVFRSDYRDLQVIAYVYDPAVNQAFQETRNAATSLSQGVELEGKWVVAQEFRVSANVTYLDAHYVRYQNAPATRVQTACQGLSAAEYFTVPQCAAFPFPVANFHDASGRTLPFAPRFSGSVTARYSMPLSGGYQFNTELSPYFTSSYYFADSNDPIFKGFAGYVRLDGRLSLESPEGHWAVDLIGKNLNDRVIGAPGPGITFKQELRNVAIQVRYHY